MEPIFITHQEFWDWFNRDPAQDIQMTSKQRPKASYDVNCKRVKTIKRTRHIIETGAANKFDKRYVILYGKHKPGKKSKVWEGDGYLSMLGTVAHLCDQSGRMLEEPTALDDIDLNSVREMGELLIGNTEVQIQEVDE